MDDIIFKNLNAKQTEAVTTTEGPVLIIAGAGSGKTRALTHRIAHIIKNQGVSPWNVLAVTFTNKAANEMLKRVFKLLHPEEAATMAGKDLDPIFLRQYDLPLMGTFHSICARILRKEAHVMGYENNFTIYDTTDCEALVKQIMKELGFDPAKINPKAILSHISGAKNQLMEPSSFSDMAHNFFSEKVSQVYEIYQKKLKQNQAMDFDDLLMQMVLLFKEFPEILARYQERFKYVLVDEYQDTNHSQYTLVKMLSAKYKNICVVGDSDQSIYSWRGANMQNILDFEKDYPGAKVVLLEQNYRSTPVILDAAHEVISRNKSRKEKKMWTTREGGEKIKIWRARNERDEAEMVAKEIENRIRGHEHPDYNSFVALYRTNAQSRVLEEVFMRYGIPYRIVGGLKFYQRKEIKDLVSYLRVVQNPHDTVSILRIINMPVRNLGEKTIETVQEYAARHQMSFWDVIENIDELQGELPESKINSFKKFAKVIRNGQDSSRQYPASEVIKNVLMASGYKDMLTDGSEEGEIRYENVLELISVATKYDKLESGISLSTFLEEVALISDLDSVNESHNVVTLMTLHSAKGLEFPCVFICGVEDGVFPHSRSMIDPQEMEEERRLMYVGMTRAIDELFLLHAGQRMLYGDFKSNSPSQFLMDIPEGLVETNYDGPRVQRMNAFGERPIPVEEEESFVIELETGDMVMHKTFGKGIVINVTGGIATVSFKDMKYGVKKLAINVAPMERI